MFRLWITLAGLLGALGVALSAWSTHALPQLLPPETLALGLERARAANQQHLLHSLALFGVALWSGFARAQSSRWLHAAGCCFVLGIAGFSGGIYLIRLLADIHTGPLLRIVPLGGSCLILGWLCLAVAGWRNQPPWRT